MFFALRVVAVVSLAVAATLEAQEPQVIKGPPSCARCTIELRHVASLGSFDGPGALPGMISQLAQDSKGNFYVTTQPGTALYVFSPSGAFVRSIGRDGAGPGEFRTLVNVLVGTGDTLYLADRALHRIVVETADGKPVRQVRPIRVSISMLHLSDGRFVVNTDYRDRARIGFPLHLSAADGSYIRAFGAIEPAYGPTVSTYRVLAASPAGTVWSAGPLYQLEEWGLDGRRRRALVRRPDWFPEKLDPMARTTPDEPPQPWVSSLHIDAHGRLWTLVVVSDPEWAKGLGAEKREGRVHWYPTEDLDKLHDTIIEVIDLTSGRLLVSQRFPRFIQHFLNDSTVAGTRISKFGDQREEIWRVHLLTP